jgi:hypothetical protein
MKAKGSAPVDTPAAVDKTAAAVDKTAPREDYQFKSVSSVKSVVKLFSPLSGIHRNRLNGEISHEFA